MFSLRSASIIVQRSIRGIYCCMVLFRDLMSSCVEMSFGNQLLERKKRLGAGETTVGLASLLSAVEFSSAVEGSLLVMLQLAGVCAQDSGKLRILRQKRVFCFRFDDLFLVVPLGTPLVSNYRKVSTWKGLGSGNYVFIQFFATWRDTVLGVCLFSAMQFARSQIRAIPVLRHRRHVHATKHIHTHSLTNRITHADATRRFECECVLHSPSRNRQHTLGVDSVRCYGFACAALSGAAAGLAVRCCLLVVIHLLPSWVGAGPDCRPDFAAGARKAPAKPPALAAAKKHRRRGLHSSEDNHEPHQECRLSFPGGRCDSG